MFALAAVTQIKCGLCNTKVYLPAKQNVGWYLGGFQVRFLSGVQTPSILFFCQLWGAAFQVSSRAWDITVSGRWGESGGGEGDYGSTIYPCILEVGQILTLVGWNIVT